MKHSIGHSLRILRLKKNLTQLQVAQSIGISEKSISRYENDKTTPKEELLNMFAESYEVPVSKIRVV
ncbi:helix-turn-helix transcriptional regulator [Bacillus sp. 1P02SD]|uniref:helix-turn-helix transcriptional regulator n=1 Tax=Bacillus sp. 1P02SD TaxID=3132264 RepID=UPI0039A2D3C0